MPTAQNGSDGEHVAHLEVNRFSHTVDLADVVHGYVICLVESLQAETWRGWSLRPGRLSSVLVRHVLEL